MIAGIRIKVCGITSLVDAEAADAVGADFLGFIFHEASPRHVPAAQWKAMVPRLPPRRKVAVAVSPTAGALRGWSESGIDFFQVHFPDGTPASTLEQWKSAVGAERLWLAPRLPPGAPFPEWILDYAGTVLWDAFARDSYGGTGRTADWPAFRAARQAHRGHTWVLAGGLTPDNVAEALSVAGAGVLDVNSGVEAAPGVKDPDKLRLFFERVRAAVQPRGNTPADAPG